MGPAWRLKPSTIPLSFESIFRQRPRVLRGTASQQSYSTMRVLIKDDDFTTTTTTTATATGRRNLLLVMLGIEIVQVRRRQYCCCSSWDRSSSNLVSASRSNSSNGYRASRDSSRSKDSVVRQQRQNLPRITVYNDSKSARDSNVPPEQSSFAKQRQHRLSKSSQRLIEANEQLERAIKRAALNHRHLEHYDYSLYGLNPALDQAVGRHQRETMLYNQDRHLKEEQAKLVAPGSRQSPIAIMSMNPTYELQDKPLIIEYPATLENLRLNNSGFSWEVKIPYQISMATALYGAHLNTAYRYRLDQFHCHWGPTDDEGSEHTVDNKCYSAEIHFVHYNMEKYHTMSKAARHPDGLVVVSVFLDAHSDHHNHAELEKIVSQLKSVSLKGEHTIIRQAVRIENLLPADKSYWSYQGSLTTPPYFESVTWFVLKHPIKCSVAQIHKFRNLKSSLQPDDDVGTRIITNHRKTQPLNGRTIVNYDETSGSSGMRSSYSHSIKQHSY